MPTTLTTHEAAKVAGVSVLTIHNWRNRRNLQFRTVGTRLVIDADDFQRYLDQADADGWRRKHLTLAGRQQAA